MFEQVYFTAARTRRGRVSAEPGQDPGEYRNPRHDADARPVQDSGPDDHRGPAGGSRVWGLEDAQAGADPDSSCPAEYVGVPLREVFAAADAWEAGHPQAAGEPWDAGFLPRDVPATARSGDRKSVV